MEIKLNLEQISYLKSLDSKKKKRKFILDCLIENVEIGESDKLATSKEIESKLIEEAKNKGFLNSVTFIPLGGEIAVTRNGNYFRYNDKENTLLYCNYLIYKDGEWAKIIDSLIEKPYNCEKYDSCSCNKICFLEENKKGNYSPEEIELVKHNINQREVTEQGNELLKFDMLEKESLTQNDLEGNSVEKTEEAVKITLKDGTVIWKTKWMVLEEPKKSSDDFFKEINEKCNSLKSDLKKVVSDFETKNDGLKVFIDIDKIGCLVEEKLFDEFNQSAK